jgi:hypothetical protein
MHPRIHARAVAVERAKKEDVYRSLDELFAMMITLCRQAGLDSELPLSRHRQAVAEMARTDRLSVDQLISLADTLTGEAENVAQGATEFLRTTYAHKPE